MGIRKYLRERKEARRLYNKGYNTDTMQMHEGVQHMVERKRERLQRKAEYHSQKGQEFGNYMRAVNQGDGSSLLGAAGSLGHKMKASYYQHKLNSGGLDRYAIRKQKQIAGKIKFKGEEDQEHYSISSNFKKLGKKVKLTAKTVKEVLITGDKKNKRIPYREKRAPMELRTVKQEHELVKKQLEKAKKNPGKFSDKKIATLKRRDLAARKKMKIADERKFYNSRISKKDLAILAGATATNVGMSLASVPIGVTNPLLGSASYIGGSVVQYGAPGLRALSKYRNSVLDRRYEYMKKNGYVK